MRSSACSCCRERSRRRTSRRLRPRPRGGRGRAPRAGELRVPPAEQQSAPPADQPPAPAQPPAEQDLGDESDRRRQKVDPVATAAASTTVTIEDFAFSPKSITVDVGDTVTWRNNDDVAHS